MYSKILRALSLLLALIMVSAVAISCDKASTNEDPETDTQVEPTDESRDICVFPPDPDIDFEGEEITILIRDNILYSREWCKEEAEDELDEVIAMRDKEISYKFDLNVKYELVPDASHDTFATAFNEIVANDVNSGTHKYDIAANGAYTGTIAAVRNYIATLNNKQAFPYFNFSFPCWNQSLVKNTTINGRLYYIAGDMNFSMFDSATVLWCNESLYNRYKEESDPEDIQQYAFDGKWTYDDLYTLASRFYTEGDDTSEGLNALGFSEAERDTPYDAIPYAWDLDFVATNNDGTHSFSFENNQKAEEALGKLRTLINAKGTRKNADVEDFAGGHYLFWAGPICSSVEYNDTIREMDYRYCILPVPKYEASQEKYRTTVNGDYNLITVLKHFNSTLPTKGDAVSAYLQFSAEEYFAVVKELYFHERVNTKFVGAAPDHVVHKGVFLRIVDGIELDYRTIYSPQLNNITRLWRDTVNTDGTLEEAYLQNKDAYEQALKDTDAWLGLGSNQ